MNHITSLVLIAGLSGAGKSTAIDTLEDLNYFAIDNLPVPLLANLIDLSQNAASKFARTALLLDIHSKNRLDELMALIPNYGRDKIQIIFLDCNTDIVIRRYSETRRPHPGFDPTRDKSLEDTIQRERNRLLPLKQIANYIIDTSNLTVHDLKREIREYVATISSVAWHTIRVNFMSFGFKFGVPVDCDLVADVRFLPNPHFVDELRSKTGHDVAVANYVLTSEEAIGFIKRYVDLLDYLIPHYAFEGKSYLNIGIGCTGGHHRSVAIAEELSRRVSSENCMISVKHRDIDRK